MAGVPGARGGSMSAKWVVFLGIEVVQPKCGNWIF
jgi:hypothetical protein